MTPRRLVCVSLPTAALLLASLTCVACGHPGEGPQDLGDPALAHVRKLVEFGPRPAGSPALRQCGDYVIGQLEKAGCAVETDEWEERGIKFRNILGKLEGDPKRIVILASHYDTKKFEGHPDAAHNFRFVGANDGGSSTGLVLTLAQWLKEGRRPGGAKGDRTATVWFAFFDGEECLDPVDWQDENALFGSRRMATRLVGEWKKADLVKALILLDLVGAKDVRIDYDNESSPVLLDLFQKTAKRLGYEKHFAPPAQGYAVKDDHIPFQRKGVPVIDLIDLKDRQPPQGGKGDAVHHWHTPFDTVEVLSARSLQVIGEVVLAAWPEIEKL
jgi:glutaminyl-peptide cyclotransferase